MKKLLLMKNNLFFIKKTQRQFTALLIVVCGLFANTISAQTTYTWVGGIDNNWETPANWETAIGVPATNAPGNATNDAVVISNGASVLYSTTTTKTIQRLTVSNLTGPSSGSTLTIASGASLQVSGGGASQPIIIRGGTIVNNGTLEVISSASNTLTYSPFNIANPDVAPVVGGPFTYGYTGGANSNLTITYNTPAGSTASAAFLINATSTFSDSKISLVFGGTNTINFTTTANQTMAIRTVALNAAPLSISGTGFTTNTGLIAANPGSNITVEAGTTLTSTVSGFLQHNMVITSDADNSTTFTNKGTLNIGGTLTGKHGIQLVCANSAFGNTLTFENQGTINVDIATSTTSTAAFGIQNSGTTARGNILMTNSASGIMNLKNTLSSVNAPAFWVAASAGSPNVDFINDGSLNLSSKGFNTGGQIETKITNNGLITSNNEIRTITLLNNIGKKISFVKDASTIANARAALTNFLIFNTNNGIIETATGTLQLNNLARVFALSSTSVIEPGGPTGKGLAIFSATSYPLSGTLKMQVEGTVAGTSFDQIPNTLATGGSFTLSGATLDVTGIYTPAGPVTIDIITASTTVGFEGTITGTFDSVIGLTSGWSVNYIPGTAGSVVGKVQLVYSSLKVNDLEFNKNSVSVYKNNGALYVNSGAVAINNIKVYDLLGRMVVEQKDVKANTASINNLKAINQVLIVKILSEDNKVVTKKVVF